jgi:hypothetical protein
MRSLGQAVGEIDPGWGNVEGVPDLRRKHEPEDGGGCERVGQSGSPDGKARSLRRGCRWRVDWTEEANPDGPSEAVLIQIGWVDSLHRPPSAGRRSVPLVPEPT